MITGPVILEHIKQKADSVKPASEGPEPSGVAPTAALASTHQDSSTAAPAQPAKCVADCSEQRAPAVSDDPTGSDIAAQSRDSEDIWIQVCPDDFNRLKVD